MAFKMNGFNPGKGTGIDKKKYVNLDEMPDGTKIPRDYIINEKTSYRPNKGRVPKNKLDDISKKDIGRVPIVTKKDMSTFDFDDKSPLKKNGKDDKNKIAGEIFGQEIEKDGKGNYRIGVDYNVAGVGKVITDPKGILKKYTKDGFIQDLDFTYTTKGDTTSITGVRLK